MALEQGFRFSTVEGPYRQKERKVKQANITRSSSHATLSKTHQLGRTDLTRYNSLKSFREVDDDPPFTPMSTTDRSSYDLLAYMVGVKNEDYVNKYPALDPSVTRPRTAPLIVMGDTYMDTGKKKKKKKAKSKGDLNIQELALVEEAANPKMNLLFLEHPEKKANIKKFSGNMLTLRPHSLLPPSSRITHIYKRPLTSSTEPLNPSYMRTLNVSPKHKNISTEEINMQEFVLNGTWGKQTMWEQMKEGRGPHPKKSTNSRLTKLHNDMPDRWKSPKYKLPQEPVADYSVIAKKVRGTKPANNDYFEKIATPSNPRGKFDARAMDEALRHTWGEKEISTPHNIEDLIRISELDKEKWQGKKFKPTEQERRQSLWRS